MGLGLHRFFHRRHAIWWTLVTGLILTAALGSELHREAVELDRERLQVGVAKVRNQLDSQLEKSEMLLHNLRDYLMFSGETRTGVFARWCYENGLSINCSWLYGIAVATNRNRAQWQTQLPGSPQIWTQEDWATFLDLVRRQLVDCGIALRSEVKDHKRFLTDYDLQRSFQDIDPLGDTIRESRVAMSDRRPVMEDAHGKKLFGTVYYVPVYRPEVADGLAAEGLTRNQNTGVRWMHLTSVILAPVDFNELARSIWSGAPADLGIELFSSTNQTAETWLNGTNDNPRATDPKFKAYLTHRQIWPMYGNRFSIFFYTTPLFEAQSPRRLAQIAVAAGVVLTLLATALAGVAARAHDRQELMTEQIRDARDALAAAQKAKEKFSRDLHDGTIQSLYAIQLGLGHLAEKVKQDPTRARLEFSTVRKELDAVIAEIRQFISADASLSNPVNFGAVLRSLVQRAQAGTTARITLQCDSDAVERLSAAHAVQLANIAREAISNSLRHAQPAQVQVTLRSDQDKLALEVFDDGAGFDPGSPNRFGVGLASMRSRAQEMGGSFEIESHPKKGTRILVRVPSTTNPP